MEDTSIETPEAVDAPFDSPLHNTIYAALKENPKTRNLSEDQIRQICQDAIAEEKYSDELWLHQRIKEAEDASPHIPGSKILKIPVSGPASIENQDDLDQAIAQHQLWMDSVLHPTMANKGGRANLEGCDLRGLSLENADLKGAKLMGANLEGCTLDGAILSTCNLEDANLKGASLMAAKLRRCRLSGADFSECDLTRADLRMVEYTNVNWTGAILSEALVDDDFSTTPKERKRGGKAKDSPAQDSEPKVDEEGLEAAGEEDEDGIESCNMDDIVIDTFGFDGGDQIETTEGDEDVEGN